ncbi:TSN [Bugula neritina]|uniref:Translin n=1 Tax=Bugula neritina TaxID=10212 RepID=A0A7J7KR97_BUGNE|nr:TSN [Bugula neritina]
MAADNLGCGGDTITAIFGSFQKDLELEQEKREDIRVVVKELDQTVRQMITTLQSIHKPGGLSKVTELVEQTRAILKQTIPDLYSKLAETVSKAEFYRYHDHWKFCTQKLTFVVTFIEFLSTGKLLLWHEAADSLSLTTDRSSDKLYYDLEDYLHGLVSLSNELSRLAVNSVTAADYAKPLQIAAFMNDLDSGFRLLNLKNDSLRKRFDSMKYDMRKVEEVVYDISIRGLTAAPQESESSKAKDESSSV